ncbi:hypothetical protein Huta_1810 [Halorhabdus utahensis DSM 12940]|uniref:Uncharacterized protein n=1 Tax=Halorhabdus utahensis (strain DSM 12940 / JCM 11049 / AX-2) TaxID=519442 RepID=C7NRP5_HALUD|nr:hypothetical protein Huta_1810 [Halorhabdus utahensis DSM 12940]
MSDGTWADQLRAAGRRASKSLRNAAPIMLTVVLLVGLLRTIVTPAQFESAFGAAPAIDPGVRPNAGPGWIMACWESSPSRTLHAPSSLPSAALAKSGTTLGRIAPVLVVIRVALALSHVLLARDPIAVTVESAHADRLSRRDRSWNTQPRPRLRLECASRRPARPGPLGRSDRRLPVQPCDRTPSVACVPRILRVAIRLGVVRHDGRRLHRPGSHNRDGEFDR